jgi:hypothetical protein
MIQKVAGEDPECQRYFGHVDIKASDNMENRLKKSLTLWKIWYQFFYSAEIGFILMWYK